ncbi:MAG: bifunctional anthranilate synthase component I family protein/class IV aminotransferase [Campylobacter lanienae]|uniref:bifunctional chorismate-binding protein/class IV aminotransferase n=1 Tax=Campylobacter lanienae TaxID=75658 RepID=UPI00243207C6|nr:bifunctional anthranilate synthase component I family protein/class IV aminotransferase [Campylobacter lanienae]MCI5540327.1 bifunctional anthranilate synthase component I family protein/class IV aminotransferase [Campylobacter lanienae]
MSEFSIFGKYLYRDLKSEFICFNKDELNQALKTIQKIKNLYFVGYIVYDISKTASNYPIAHFKGYKNKEIFKAQKSFEFSIFKPYFYPQIVKNLSKKEYEKAFNQIKDELASGNSYQINFTNELQISTKASSKDIITSLLSRQKSRYFGYFRSEFCEIISFSPELFFKLKDKKITFAPMKGTIKRGQNKDEDRVLKNKLKNDPKNRSENLMIVDLLRNDMSKIIKIGSLKLKEPMKIIKLKTLFQAISPLKARLKSRNLNKIFEAVYPCGSITGAPKLATMRIIERLEDRDRGVYCGAMGVISDKRAEFSVPIRTLQRWAKDEYYRYGVGSGVVWDSKCDDEFAELELKSSFLRPKIEFNLFETMLLRGDKIFLLQNHLKRLINSARLLGFKLPMGFELCEMDEERLKFSDIVGGINGGFESIDKFKDIFANLRADNVDLRVNLTLNKSGKYQITQTQIPPLKSHKIAISQNRLNSCNDLLYHKTTLRDERIIDDGLFDIFYLNQRGELCEGSRSNIVLNIGGELLTPKLDCGLLAGTLRERLLKFGEIKEAILGLDDLKNAKEIYAINSLRGAIKVEL